MDGTLTWQSRLLAFPHEWWDFSTAQGIRGYASPNTLQRLETAFQQYTSIPLLFWGTGDFHYVTYVRLRLLRVPVTLVLFDRHHDAAPVANAMVNCGNWVRHALGLPWVRKVIWIGGGGEGVRSTDPPPVQSPRFAAEARLAPPEDPAALAAWVQAHVPTDAVYLSVDKDVLTPADAVTSWGSGAMALSDLLRWIDGLLRYRRVVGADVGGEWALPPDRPWPSPADRQAFERNERANLALLQALQPVAPLQRHPVRRTG